MIQKLFLTLLGTHPEVARKAEEIILEGCLRGMVVRYTVSQYSDRLIISCDTQPGFAGASTRRALVDLTKDLT